MTVVIFIALCFSAIYAVAQPVPPSISTNSTVNMPGLPYRPKDGDKLGYSKEESIRLLDPEVRSFLDGVLRLYKEPGVFVDRREVFRALGTEPGEVRMLYNREPAFPATAPYRQSAANKGVFARVGWTAEYTYRGLERDIYMWRLDMRINVPKSPDCIDSRAVEGYLDLYLRSGLDGYAHPLPAYLWDRHGISGSPYGTELFPSTPKLRVGFVGGCLVGFSLENYFNYTEVSDENVRNR